MVILQTQSGHVHTFTLASQPADTSVLTLFADPHGAAYPSGCAASWSKLANDLEEWRGIGPFSGVTIHVTPGRTPPSIDALIMEIG